MSIFEFQFDFEFGVQTLQILGWTLLHSLWIGALIGLIFGALRPLVQNKISLRYWLGILCLFAFAAIEFTLLFNALISALMLAPVAAANSGETMILTTLGSTAAAPFTVQSSAPPLTFLLGFLWLLGVCVSTWRLIRSHRTLRLLALNAQTDTYSGLRRLCEPLLDLLHLRANVRFAVSELIDVPCVIGLFKPLVLLPAALLARMPQDQLELVLLHELSHIKNGDLWINSAQVLVEVLMFFHPVVHWISADVRATRERRCDRAVLSLRATPVRYAHALVSLEEFRHEFRGLALAATGGELTSRVRDILAPRTPSVTINTRRSMRGTVLLSLAAAMVLAGAVSSAFMQQTVTAPVEPEKQTVIAPDNFIDSANVMNTVASGAAAAMTDARLARFTPLAKPAQSKLTSADVTSIVEATPQMPARKVLLPPRNLLAKQTLATHIFEPIATFELATLDAITIEPVEFETPKIIARVQPVFAPGEKERQAFTLSFSLNAAGIPRQIVLTRGQASKRQLVAAKTALAQWRFEPEASAKFAGNRLEQSFSFREVRSDECTPSVGTRICR